MRLSIAAAFGAVLLTAAATAQERIPLEPGMLLNLSGQKPADALADEQELAGDPKAGRGGKPATAYTNGWINRDLHYPLAVVVDLGAPHKLTDAFLYDMEGGGKVTIEAGPPGSDPPAEWKPLAVDPLAGYMTWNRHPVDVETRYLKLTFADPGAKVGEIVLYGTATGPRPKPPEPRPRKPAVTMDVFIGLNGFIDDPIDKLAAGGQVREYHSWVWDVDKTSSVAGGKADLHYAFNPSGVRGPGWGWDFDGYYRSLKAAGVIAAPVMQNTPPLLKDGEVSRTEEKPIADGADPTDPASYKEHAAHLYQFAARYGRRPASDDLLRLSPEQLRVSGLELVRFVEGWNEPDKTWRGRAAYFNPAELAAMCSADCDGHRGALGEAVGVKTADPQMSYVLPGLAFPEIEYLRAMKFWADVHRGGDFPADVINLHTYSNDVGNQGGGGTVGVSPEADRLKERIRRFVEYRDQHLPGKELWVSEFGYDTNPQSVQRAPAIGEADAEEVQGRWLVRSFLELAAAGVDRAQLYMLRDVNAEDATKYASSGLTASKNLGHAPKKSWFYVKAMRTCLTGYRFDAEVDSGRPDVRVSRFIGEGKQVYAVWCPTSADVRVPGYVVPGMFRGEATLTTLEPGDPDGVTRSLPLTGGRVVLDLSERPVFVTVDDLQ